MKFRVAGACASIILLAGCSGGNPGSQIDSLRNTAAVSQSAAKGSPQLSFERKAHHSIANAPNRGALVNYQNGGKPAKVEGAYTWYPIAISEEHAMQALLTGQMTVPSPDGSQVKLRYERHEEHPDGNWTWVGRVVGGDPNQEAILTFGEKAVYGSIPQANGPALSLETRQGVLYAVKTDPSKVRNPNTAATDIMVPPALALRESVSQAAGVQQGATMQSATMAGAPATAANTIDVAVGYTAGFAASVGGQSAAVTRLTFLTQVGNQAFENSQVNGYLRLVRAIQVNYADNTKNSDALSELTGNNGTANVPVPASLVPLRDARNEFGADVAVLVRRFQTPENDGCGVAWLNGADQTAINPATDANYAFAVISDGSDQGTDGNNYVCAPETMVHEIGHIAGSAHDRDNSKKANGELQYGSFAYSFGMKTDSANGNFYTVMSYGSNNQIPYRTFSNPNITICGGRACGVANTTDNARSLNQTISIVSTFRATVVPHDTPTPPALIDSKSVDVNGDVRSDLLWMLNDGSQFAYWTMDGGNKQGGVGYAMGTAWKLIASGDFYGDGGLDFVWSDYDNIQLWNNHAGGMTPYGMRSYPRGYDIVAVGDVNGDGRADLVWRDEAKSQISIWLMNGTTIIGSASYVVGSSWNILASGDLNGDNRLDLIWHDGGVQFQAWLGIPSGFTGATMPAYPTGWSLFGIGDMDGDNRDDLFWRHAATGEVGIWRMSGGTRLSGHGFQASSSWKPVQVTDYTGDGRADIVWTNNTAMQLWQSQGTTFTGVVMPNYPAGWTLLRR